MGLLKEECITELICGSNFSYILNDDKFFALTEYKMLQKQSESNFVQCMKILYNGKIQLYYSTKGFKSLGYLVKSINEDAFIDIVKSLLKTITNVMQNGFLSCQNICLTAERIYVDEETHQVYLTYLPFVKKEYDEYVDFENDLKTILIQIIEENSNIQSSRTKELLNDLEDKSIDIEQICGHIKREKKEVQLMNKRKTFRIVALNSPEILEIEIAKDSFVLGRSAQLADGVIPHNRMIGRAHCSINKEGDNYFVTDLSSLNGTYVNGKQVPAKTSCLIKDGDILRMSTSEFKVTIV